jgi:hypothetical protein
MPSNPFPRCPSTTTDQRPSDTAVNASRLPTGLKVNPSIPSYRSSPSFLSTTTAHLLPRRIG